METIVLKQQIVDKITADGALFGKIAEELNIAPVSLPRLLYKKDQRLTQSGVLKIIRAHIGVEGDSELLEVIENESDNKSNVSESILQK